VAAVTVLQDLRTVRFKLEVGKDDLCLARSTAHIFKRLHIASLTDFASLRLPSMAPAEFTAYAKQNGSFRDQLIINARIGHALFGQVQIHIHFPSFVLSFCPRTYKPCSRK